MSFSLELRQKAEQAAALALRGQGQVKDEAAERTKFATVCQFLFTNPESLSWRGNSKPDPLNHLGYSLLAKKFFDARLKLELPTEPSTVSDPMVGVVLQEAYGYNASQTGRIETEHKHSMSAENTVGGLLERYLASVLEPHGWVWCAGDFVKAIDFIKLNSSGRWELLQVKNRDNSENSSSSAIRNGTDIEKWFRTFARTGKTNWAAFPDASLRGKLSESAFEQFVRAYLRAAKAAS